MSSNRGIFWVKKSELNSFARGELNKIYSTFYDTWDGLPGLEANGGMQNTAIDLVILNIGINWRVMITPGIVLVLDSRLFIQKCQQGAIIL
jgi:hypothetical protein